MKVKEVIIEVKDDGDWIQFREKAKTYDWSREFILHTESVARAR